MNLEAMLNLRLFKDAANAGYKLDLNRLFEIRAVLLRRNLGNLSRHFIPIINVISQLKINADYLRDADQIIKLLIEHEVAVPLTDKEQKKYKSLPIGINAVFISNKYTKETEKNTTVVIHAIEDKKSIIIFRNDENGKQIVVDVKGYLNTLNETELEEELTKVENVFGLNKKDQGNTDDMSDDKKKLLDLKIRATSLQEQDEIEKQTEQTYTKKQWNHISDFFNLLIVNE